MSNTGEFHVAQRSSWSRNLDSRALEDIGHRGRRAAYSAAGLVLLAWPASGAVSLTLVLIVFFIIEGVASIMYAIDHRRQFSGRWGFMLVSGIIDLVLAAIIYGGLPGTAAWALGVLVGINMIFGGAALLAMAIHARTTA
jgi:uncharacterized membrane protein HdeD (DUF308 family)